MTHFWGGMNFNLSIFYFRPKKKLLRR